MISKFIQKYKNSNVIFKASVWFVLVTIIDNAISVLTQPFVNRILTVDQVGIYNVYNTWATIFRIIATFNLFCGVYEVFLVDNKEDQKQVRGSLCFLSTLTTFVFFGIIFAAIIPISSLTGLRPLYFVVMFLFVISEEIIQFYIVQLRFNYKYIKFSIFVVTLFLIKSILTILLAYFFVSDRVLGRIVGLTVPMIVVATVLFILIIKESNFKYIAKYWKQALKFNLPLIPHYLSSILLASSDKVMLQYLTNDYYVGIYSVVYSFSSLSLIVFTALNNSYTPWAYNALKEKKYLELSKKTNLIVFLSILFCIMLMLFAPEGVYILGGVDYLIALPIVPILICGTFFSSFYFIFSNVEFINKKTKIAFPITLTGALINISLNWCLISVYGYEAAAYTTLIGYVFIAICHYVYSRLIAKEKIFDMKTILALLFCLIGCTFGCIYIYKLSSWIRYLLIFFVGVISIIVFFKKFIQKDENMVTSNERNNI
ncbi:MAG: oligosaccharide flippase family protein [Clostridia bacterium]|nr:oligosaccharide flippase family protein [Clostridia bacterium]